MHKALFPFGAVSLLMSILFWMSCGGGSNQETPNSGEQKDSSKMGTYGYDHSFLKEHVPDLLELRDSVGEAAILISPKFQGRVMTSTALGDSGASFGWINYELISGGQFKPKFNPVGGEERFWLGPEGGQFSLFFKKGDSFNIANWQVPALVDTMPYRLRSSDHSEAVFSRDGMLTNFSGTDFHMEITRTIRMISKSLLQQRLRIPIPQNLASVAYESENQLKNTGTAQWRKEKGLISIWLLGQLRPSDQTFVFIPFRPVQNPSAFITDDYFGKIPKDRLLIQDSVLIFKCDGKQRGKIGISPKIAGHLAASFDFEKNLLTVISFEVEKDGLYVNSKWEMQKEPYQGDVVNAYNDGPLADGTQLGPFYEVEASSSTKELRPGEIQQYKQLTCHFQGNYQSLRTLVLGWLGVDLDLIKKRP
jgi:hypothetical protein